MSPWQRKEQFPDEPFDVRVSDNNEEYLFCTCCGKLVSHQQKTFVQSHVDSKGHQQAHKTWKESRQIEFYRQLRILNPRNLPDMPRAMDQYPLLGLSDVLEIAEQWSLYIRCNAVDINGPTALQEW